MPRLKHAVTGRCWPIPRPRRGWPQPWRGQHRRRTPWLEGPPSHADWVPSWCREIYPQHVSHTLAVKFPTFHRIEDKRHHPTHNRPNHIILQCGGNDAETRAAQSVIGQYGSLISEVRRHCPMPMYQLDVYPHGETATPYSGKSMPTWRTNALGKITFIISMRVRALYICTKETWYISIKEAQAITLVDYSIISRAFRTR